MILDEDPPALSGLIIEGTLDFDQSDLELTTDWILINSGGALRIGRTNKPHEFKATITLTDTNTEDHVIMQSGTRGIIVAGGTLALHGTSTAFPWTKLSNHALQGSFSIEVTDATDWQAGDEIIITPTDYYLAGTGNQSETQRTTIDAIDGNIITLADPLNASRWGLLQYVSADGMTLNANEAITPPGSSTPVVLDERAEVALLTRNIVIQSIDDDLWKNNGYGAQTMIMRDANGIMGKAYLDGVEFTRAGQAGITGGYPFHQHMQSYSGTQTFGDAIGQYVRNSAVNTSANRGFTIHGTNGLTFENNILFDILGHGFFMEDAIERRNIIRNNLVAKVRVPAPQNILMPHENGERGPSAYWLTNPDNTIENNIAADSKGFGFWLAFPPNPWREGSAIQIIPNRIKFGIFSGNTAHSNGNDGFHLDDPEILNDGTTGPVIYISCSDDRCNGEAIDFAERFTIKAMHAYKNLDNGTWERGPWINYEEGVFADNCGRFSAGSGADGLIENSLYIGTSLNHLQNQTGRPAIADFQFFSSSCPTALATYHSAFAVRNSIFAEFETPDKKDRCGFAATDDLYIRGVSLLQRRFQNNVLINTYPGTKLQAEEVNNHIGQFVFAGAYEDTHGYWEEAGRYLVDDVPFLTYGKEVRTLSPGTEIVGAVGVEGPFFSVGEFVFFCESFRNTPEDFPCNPYYEPYMPFCTKRFNDSSQEIDEWCVDQGFEGQLLPNMRHFAVTDQGYYLMEISDNYYGGTPPDFIRATLEGMFTEEHRAVVGFPWDNSLSANVFVRQESLSTNTIGYDEVDTFESLRSSAGKTYYIDTNENIIWIHFQGQSGFWKNENFHRGFDPFEDGGYESMTLIIETAN